MRNALALVRVNVETLVFHTLLHTAVKRDLPRK